VYPHASARRTLQQAAAPFPSPLPLVLLPFPSWPVAVMNENEATVLDRKVNTHSFFIRCTLDHLCGQGTDNLDGRNDIHCDPVLRKDNDL